MPANVISGRVELKETGVGIPGLRVVIHDVADTGTGIAPSAVALSLGSQLTDEEGAFKVTYKNEEFQIRNADPRWCSPARSASPTTLPARERSRRAPVPSCQ